MSIYFTPLENLEHVIYALLDRWGFVFIGMVFDRTTRDIVQCEKSYYEIVCSIYRVVNRSHNSD